MQSMGAYGYVRRHGQQHSLFDPQGGDDTVWVWGQQFLPFLVQETDPISLYVDVRVGHYIYNNSYRTFGGGTSPDLSTYAPGAGLAVMLHIVVNASSGFLDYIVGSEFSTALPGHMRVDMIPLAPEGTLACGAIYIPNGVTEITWDEIYDTRPFVQAVQSGGAHNILSTTHTDTSADDLVRGDLLVAVADEQLARLAAGGAYQFLHMDATGDDPEWRSFDWDYVNQAGGADMVHTHLSDPEGGLIGYELRTGWNLDVATEVTMAWNDGTRTLSLTPTGASYSFWVEGTEYTEAVGDSVVINDTEGLWYIYYNNVGTLTASQVPWNIRDNDKAFVSVLYWDATNNVAIGGSSRWEMHSWGMAAGTHSWAHRTIGTRWQSGLAVSENPADQLEVTAGIVRDEELYINVTDGAGAGLFEQDLSPLQAYKIYKLGAAGDWRHGGAFGVVPVILDGANDVVWNEWTGAVWQLTAAGANQYCAYWVISTPDIHNPVVVMVGQGAPAANASAARDNNPIETLDTTSEGPEFRVLARVIVRNIAGGVFYEVSAIDDFRLIEVIAGTITFVDHNALPGLQGGLAGEYYHLDATDYTDIAANTQLAQLQVTGSPTFADVYVPDGGTLGIVGNELLTVNAAGTFAFSGIAGITVEDADYIGNSVATARLVFNSAGAIDYAYFLSCNVGIGWAAVGNTHLYVRDTALTSTATFYGGRFQHTKTGGAGAAGDDYIGLYASMNLNQATTIDNLYGGQMLGIITQGTADIVEGCQMFAQVTGGTVNVDVRAFEVFADVDAGIVTGSVMGLYAFVDIEAAVTSIGGNVFGARIWVDADTVPTGTVYMLYLAEQSNIDYGIYQSGSADNYFGGEVGIGALPTGGQCHIDNVGTVAQPVLYLDQGDVSEEMIQFETTIGVGNAIEAVGGKTLTVTHFIKVTIPGPLTRYIPCGTIA
jgi:hypothetical protein